MKHLKDLWDEGEAGKWSDDPLELLRYRSNLLGADLRITNFGGGNTSSKFELPDPFTGQPVRVMAVKGSGGDLGSIRREGFALLYLDRLEKLREIYRGEEHEDEMVGYYPLASFGASRAAPSIDTPLHAFLPFPHIDHLHPDWAIALAASANGEEKLEEFNRRFGLKVLWAPWQRPGFELALMLQRLVEASPDCDGLVLGSHGLFTWGQTQQECYRSSLEVIDRFGEFVLECQNRKGTQKFGGVKFKERDALDKEAAQIFPFLRGRISVRERFIGDFQALDEVMQFANSNDAKELAYLGTSCPDHFVRTKIRPLFVEWDPDAEDLESLKRKIEKGIEQYRIDYSAYYASYADEGSPPMRSPDPTVVLIPGLGMFAFGRSKKEARISGEFYMNAIRVMAGATALEEPGQPPRYPQAKKSEDSRHFTSFRNYVALPPREAFRIEYWALEEAKLRRMPPEKELARKIFVVAGAGSGIGRAAALHLAQRGAHVVAADRDRQAAEETGRRLLDKVGQDGFIVCEIDVADRESVANALQTAVLNFGGLDGVVNTAAVFPSGDAPVDRLWRETMDVNVTGNFILAQEAQRIFLEQGLTASIILTTSANAIVPKRGSEAYDVSKSAVSHLIRELAVGFAPLVRVNGIAPATVIEGSSMFPRARLVESLKKYDVAFESTESKESLREKLARFYSRRTLTGRLAGPEDCAEAVCWLAGDRAAAITGHIIPVDGGLIEAFFR